MPVLPPERNLVIRGIEALEISKIGPIVINLLIFRSEEPVASVRHSVRALFDNPVPLDSTEAPDQPTQQFGHIR